MRKIWRGGVCPRRIAGGGKPRPYGNRRALVFALATLLAPSTALALPAGADGRALRDAAYALHELRVEDAAPVVERLTRAHPDDADVRFERAMIRFYQGDYPGAVADLDAAGDRPTLRSAEDRQMLAGLIRETRETTRSFETARSEDGRYVVRHAPGPDAILVPYALEAMRATDRALTQELGVRVPGPIRLEIYPTAATLARVSSLTVEEIQTTGTIALSKWDRLMVTSPRALVRGYPWLDTIAHENVHLVLARASRDRAPVWFQEGVAKFLERRWRDAEPGAHLDAIAETYLYTAARCPGGGAPAAACANAMSLGTAELLGFDRLHPSIARLPSQHQAALAFAQVATFVEVFYSNHGRTGLQRAITAMAGGADARDALAAVSGGPFAALERSWQEAVRHRPVPPRDPPRLLARRLHFGGGEPNELDDVADTRARRFLRLGDLLWARSRPAAAAVEYGRAHDIAPGDPILASRFARAALVGERPADAIRALERAREDYADHAPTWAVSGAAWLALGEEELARDALRRALHINPFDPQPHCDLARASGDESERGRERAMCDRLGGSRR